ncbi:hypothetical protein BDV18DRAFT_156373 [Aspergillus unguis]
MEPPSKRLRTQSPETDAVSIYSTDSETVRFSDSEPETPCDQRRPSPFLSLPRELRSLIYQYAFSTSSSPNELIHIIVERDHLLPRPGAVPLKSARQVRLRYTRKPALHLPVALLATNHQIYQEALPVVLSGVSFSFASNPTSLTFLLDRFSETARNSIRHLRLYPAPLYVRNGPLGEQLSWAVLCAQVARLRSLKKVDVLYNRVQDLKLNSIPVQRGLYGKWLGLIMAAKEPAFEHEATAADVTECRARLRDIVAAAEALPIADV